MNKIEMIFRIIEIKEFAKKNNIDIDKLWNLDNKSLYKIIKSLTVDKRNKAKQIINELFEKYGDHTTDCIILGAVHSEPYSRDLVEYYGQDILDNYINDHYWKDDLCSPQALIWEDENKFHINPLFSDGDYKLRDTKQLSKTLVELYDLLGCEDAAEHFNEDDGMNYYHHGLVIVRRNGNVEYIIHHTI